MSVFATRAYEAAQPLGPSSAESLRVANSFLDALQSDPTLAKFNALVGEYPSFDLATGHRKTHLNALEVAIIKKSLSLMDHILDLRPDLLNRASYYSEATPLCFAASHVDVQFSLRAVEKLLARGAAVNLALKRGANPLSLSALHAAHIKVTRVLLESGGVIYNGSRSAIPNYPVIYSCRNGQENGKGWSPQEHLDGLSNQRAHIAAALATLEGVSRFAQGRLYDNSAHPMNRLPLVLCKEIASFVVPPSYLNE